MARLLLGDVLDKAEQELGRKITTEEIAQATGLQANTIGRLRRGFAVSFNGDTFDLIIAYLRAVTGDETINYSRLIQEEEVTLPNPPRVEAVS